MPDFILPLFVGLLTMICAGAITVFLVDGKSLGSVRAERRLRRLSGTAEDGRAASSAHGSRAAEQRRKNIQEQLRELEGRENDNPFILSNPAIMRAFQEAGIDWPVSWYWWMSGGFAVATGLLGLSLGIDLLITGLLGIAAGLGGPQFYLQRTRRNRYRDFIKELPNAIDMIVRGTRAGLPLSACIQIVADEAREPVAGEFRRVVDIQSFGVPFAAAFSRMPKRINIPEARFLSIAISIQQESGGSLSETLENLARVLRGRAMMQGKVKALSSEAKTSAGIIGALPVLLSLGLYFLAPDYIGLLIEDPRGNIAIGASAVWMLIGVFVMRTMINFKI